MYHTAHSLEMVTHSSLRSADDTAAKLLLHRRRPEEPYSDEIRKRLLATTAELDGQDERPDEEYK
jgi:hypothetical protein